MVSIPQEEYKNDLALRRAIEGPLPDASSTLLRRVDPASASMAEEFTRLSIPPVTNAPFTASVVATWSRLVEGGGSQRVGSRRQVARDGTGRVFEEQREFDPGGDQSETALQAMEYSDPALHVLYHCDAATKKCQALPYTAPAAVAPPTGGAAAVLGERKIDGLETIGWRATKNVAPGPKIPAQEAVNMTKVDSAEFWYSPQLQINLIEKHSYTGTGDQEITVEGLSRSEPDPKLFTPPAEYTILPIPHPQQAATK